MKYYFCIRFRFRSGCVKRVVKEEFLKILKGLKQTASASPWKNLRKYDWAQETLK